MSRAWARAQRWDLSAQLTETKHHIATLHGVKRDLEHELEQLCGPKCRRTSEHEPALEPTPCFHSQARLKLVRGKLVVLRDVEVQTDAMGVGCVGDSQGD